MKNNFYKLCVFALVVLLYGCSALHKQIRHGQLDVQTKMSETIFLEPLTTCQRSVYLQLRDTSAKDVAIGCFVKQALMEKGYQIVTDPKDATLILKTNVLSASKVNEDEEAWAWLTRTFAHSGFGAAVGVGAALAVQETPSYRGMAFGGLIGAGVESLADSLVEVITYAMATDIQLTERTPKGEKVHTTRVVSLAKRTNLKFEAAKKVLVEGLSKSIAGLLE